MLTVLKLLAVASALCALPRAAADIRSRLSAANIAYVTPNDPSFSKYATPFNRRLSYSPLVIAFPNDANQVSEAVKAGVAENLKINPKSGGHSYTAYSLGGADGHLVLDLARLNSTKVSSTSAVILPGSRLGDAAIALNAQGSKALPHGTCPYVGVGGHAAHGGFGMTSRMWGLTLDRVTSLDVVLANGSQVTASSSSNSDLYWALRGAGSSYGVITAYHFNTFPAPTNAITYAYSWNLGATQFASAMAAFQTFSLSNPVRTLGGDVNIGRGSSTGTASVAFSGAFYGSLADFNAAVKPFLAAMPKPQNQNVKSGNYMASVTTLAGNQAVSSSGVDLYGEHDTFYAKSLITFQHSPLPNASLQAFAQYLTGPGYSSNTAWFVQLELYGGNSAINEPSVDSTAFIHRDALWTIQFYASSSNYAPPYPSAGITFVNGMVSSIVNAAGSGWPYGAYTNYIDDKLSTSQWQSQYYAQHYSRLQSIKAAYDPTNVFSFPQAITLPGSSAVPQRYRA